MPRKLEIVVRILILFGLLELYNELKGVRSNRIE